MKKRRDEEVEDLTEKQISWWFQELLKTLKTHTHTHTHTQSTVLKVKQLNIAALIVRGK